MVTKDKLLRVNTYPRKTAPETPRICFLLNCSSSKRESMNEEGGIYRESFHLGLAENAGFNFFRKRRFRPRLF